MLSVINGTNILTSQAKRFSVITSQGAFVDASCRGRAKYLLGVITDPGLAVFHDFGLTFFSIFVFSYF